MAFKDLIAKHATSKIEERFFWVIKIGLDTLWVALAETQNSQVEIIEDKRSKLSSKEGLEGLIEKTRQTCEEISTAREITSREAFLGVPDSWLEEEELKKPHFFALRQLISKLELRLVGYVGTHRAILNDFMSRESTPPSVILVEISKERFNLTVAKMGQIKVSIEKIMEDSLAQSLEKVLREVFTGESLPPRIFLFGEGLDPDSKGEISAYPWEETGLFLHLPKVEVLSGESVLSVVALATRRSFPPAEAYQKKSEVELTREELGFVLEKDIAEEVRESPVEEKKRPLEKKPVFPPRPFRIPRLSLPSLFGQFKKLAKVCPLPTLRFKTLLFSGLTRPALLVGGLIFLAILVLLGLYWYLPQARVVIFIEPRVLKDSLSVRVMPDLSEASESAKAVVGSKVEAEVSGVQSLATSGRKMIGDYAKGRVKVFNKTLMEKTFLGGTGLLGPNYLQFSLGGPVTINAATISTASGSETKTYGQVTCEVTAKDIGSEYNLPGGTELSFGEYSSSLYSALAEEDFSGGSSREITVVSAQDLEELEASLSARLKEKAKEDLMALAAEDKTFLPETIELSVKNKEFSQKVGEEASQVTLTMDALAQTLAFSQTALRKILAEHVAGALPEGLDLLPGGIETEQRFTEKDQDSIVLEVHFQASLVPKFDYEKIRTDLVGKSPSVAKEYLDKLPSTVGSQVYIWPPLPQRLLTLPHRAGRIKVQVEKK